MAVGENSNGTARWANLAAVVGVAIVVFGAIVTLYMRADSAFQKANDLQVRVNELSNEAGANRVEITKLADKQTEIDTQLRASIDEDNKSIAWQNRMNSMLWEQAFGKIHSHFPTDNPDFPNIANGKSQ